MRLEDGWEVFDPDPGGLDWRLVKEGVVGTELGGSRGSREWTEAETPSHSPSAMETAETSASGDGYSIYPTEP